MRFKTGKKLKTAGLNSKIVYWFLRKKSVNEVYIILRSEISFVFALHSAESEIAHILCATIMSNATGINFEEVRGQCPFRSDSKRG